MTDDLKIPRLYVLVGLPGIGKSTWVDKHHTGRRDIYVYSTDDIIELWAEQKNKTYSETFSDSIGPATECANSILKVMLHTNMSIIWDQTNLTKKKRAKILKTVPDHYRKICITFLPPATVEERDTYMNRMTERWKEGKNIPDEVLERMKSSFEFPDIDEGFDQLFTWSFR